MKIRLRRNLPSDFVRGESMISCNQFRFPAVAAEQGGGGHSPFTSEKKSSFFCLSVGLLGDGKT